MSMRLLTILQFISVFGAYFFLTVLLPALIFHRKLREERAVVRFFFYLTAGNFFFINLVFLLQLLHISNGFTLTAGTIAGAVYAAVRVKGIHVKEGIYSARKVIYKILCGTLGYRLLRRKIWDKITKAVRTVLCKINDSMRKDFPDWVLTIVITAVILWMYGTNMIECMGYTASDMPVHNYWVNAMGSGINHEKSSQIFTAGVYPFGFHCMIYYIHTVFHIETYVLFRVFGLVQTLFIHYVLLAFLRGCCRTRYPAYGAVAVYILASFWGTNSYIRYYSTLPQEFGMIFILPAVYFLFLFFKKRKEELQEGLKKNSTKYLCGFAMSFSLTLAAHFYDTIIAGIFCLGIAVGYGFRLFRKAYFGRVMLAGVISIFIAVLPMGIALAMGTPMEGSLNWAMSVISGDTQEEETAGVQEEETKDLEEETDGVAEITEGTGLQTESTSTDDPVQRGSDPPPESIGKKITRTAGRLKSTVVYMAEAIWQSVKEAVIIDEGDHLYLFLFLCLGVMGLFGVLCLLGKDKDYGGSLLSLCCGVFFLLCMLSAERLGFPALLDQNRCSIYTAYMLPIVPALAADVLITTMFSRMKKSGPANITSLFISISWIAILIFAGKTRFPTITEGLETNGAITCLTNILKENEIGTFTICSANDELRMVEDYGYFYEIINFLKEMEGEGAGDNLTISTKYVYFFIEKVPVDYTVSYEGSGQRISEEGAAHRLPSVSGLGVYEAENRWILMSRMYYWAEAFRNLYKNEMKIYYETEDFICYRVEQNPSRLFDFSIDYGFNTMFP